MNGKNNKLQTFGVHDSRAELITFKIFQFILLAKLFNVFNTLEIWCDNAIAINDKTQQ